MSTPQSAVSVPSIGPHNQGVMDALTRAKRVAVILARRGFTVYDVIATVRRARIIIKPPMPDAPIQLDAAPIIYRPTGTTMAAVVEDVQVEWTIRRTP